jgi:hypothetical protein
MRITMSIEDREIELLDEFMSLSAGRKLNLSDVGDANAYALLYRIQVILKDMGWESEVENE